MIIFVLRCRKTTSVVLSQNVLSLTVGILV